MLRISYFHFVEEGAFFNSSKSHFAAAKFEKDCESRTNERRLRIFERVFTTRHARADGETGRQGTMGRTVKN